MWCLVDEQINDVDDGKDKNCDYLYQKNIYIRLDLLELLEKTGLLNYMKCTA